MKLHDNDLFASESAWVSIYVNSKRPSKPDWVITDSSLWASRLSRSESERRRSFYTGIVTQAAGRSTSINTMDGRDILSMLGEDASRPIGLSKTEIVEGAALGSTIAEITGGGIESGLNCTYQLVSGSGSDDNADFSISGSNLLAARTLSSTQPIRHLRIRWTDGGTNTAERALTVVIARADADGDGFTEEQEITAGTDPRDPLSRLSVTSTGISGGNFSLTWASVIGKTYHVDYSSDLSTWTTISGSSQTATAETTSVTVSAMTGSRLFFRVTCE